MRSMRFLSLAVVVVLALGCGVAIAATSPTVSTGGAGSVTDTSAVVSGTVTPSGTATTYTFEYGLTPSLGTQGPTGSAGAGKGPATVKSTLTSLTPGTTYYYRLDATNAAGSAAGAIKAFKTTGSLPPGATTGAATSITTNSVTLTGVITPQTDTTTYFFNYGLTTAYGLRTAPATVPPGLSPVTVTAQVPGLEPGTTFHFQLVAVHGSEAITAGLDASFETLPSPPPVPKVAASTTPHRSRSAPFTFLTRGHIVNPSATPPALACTGSAQVTVLYGRKTIGKAVVTLAPDCTFSGGVTIRHFPAKHHQGQTLKLGVIVRFSGNSYLAVAYSKKQTVTIG